LITLTIISALILLNGLFVAAEFAIVGVSATALEAAASKGDKAARSLLRIKESALLQDRYIATAQLGITLASLGLGMYGEHQLALALRDPLANVGVSGLAVDAVATIIALAILTYFHIVLGEMIPKALSLNHAIPTAKFVSSPMRWFQFMMYPLVIGLNSIGFGVLRLLKIRREDGSPDAFYSPEEIEMVVQESTQQGILRGDQAQLLHEVLELGELSAADVMVPRVKVVGVPRDASEEEVRALLASNPHTRYPLYDGNLDRVVGVVHIKDLLRHRTADALAVAANRLPPHLPEVVPVNEVLLAMREHRTQLAVVIDEYGGTAGIVTINDIHEEVVGQIEELADSVDGVTAQSGTIVVPGTLRLEELSEMIGQEVTYEHVESVSGLIINLLRRPARTGENVKYQNLDITVLSVMGKGVEWCSVLVSDERK
jgi:CBS domain containing-hemolysin-like protein